MMVRKLSGDQQKLRGFYHNLLTLFITAKPLKTGAFYELMIANEHQPGFDTRLYIYAALYQQSAYISNNQF
jgi:hypothetical protein